MENILWKTILHIYVDILCISGKVTSIAIAFKICTFLNIDYTVILIFQAPITHLMEIISGKTDLFNDYDIS